MNSPRWGAVTKIVVASALALAAIGLLITFRQMIAPTIVAFLLTFVLSYPVNWVQQRMGWGRGASASAVFLAVALALLLLLLLLVPRFDTIMVSLQRTIDDLITELQALVAEPIIEIGPLRIATDETLAQVGGAVDSLLGALTANPMGVVSSVTSGAVSATYAVVLTFWLLKDWFKFQRFIFDLIPAGYQEEMRRLAAELAAVWQAFLRGQLTLAVVVGLVVWISLLIVGMPNAGGLALLAGILEFLPSIGPMISGTVGTVLAYFQGSTWMPVGNVLFAIIVGILYAIIGQVEGVYFIPRFVGGRVKLHPAVTFVGIITGAMTFGVLGILLAAPVIASARVLIVYVSRKLADREPFELDTTVEPVLHIPGVIAGRKVEVIVFELDGTLTALETSAIDAFVNRTAFLDRIVSPDARRIMARRFLTAIEGPIQFFLNQLWHWRWYETIERVRPTLDWLRGYPPAEELELLPGVRAALDRYAVAYRLALVSGRTRAEVQGFLRRSRLDDGTFSAVLAREDVRNVLPHVDPLLKITELFGVQANQVLVVSDSDVGLRSARAAEMATAGVTTGLALPENVREADLVVGDAAVLAAYL